MRSLLTLCLVLSSAVRAATQTSFNTGSANQQQHYISSQRREWLSDLLQRWDTPSFAIQLVAQQDDGSWHEETFLHGNASLDSGERLREEHRWAIASNSKLFAGLALSMLVEDSNKPNSTIKPINWRTTVKSLLGKRFILQDKYAENHATIEDLVYGQAMHTGLPGHERSQRFRPIDFLETQLPHLQPSAELRQKFQYCNINYNLIPLIFHHLLGHTSDPSQAFTSFVQQRIFDPADLQTATYDFEQARATGKRVEGVFRNGLSRERCQAHLRELGSEAWKAQGRRVPRPLCTGELVGVGAWTDLGTKGWMGAGGISMSLEEMGRWAKTLLDPPDWLKPHLEQATMPRTLSAPVFRNYLDHILTPTLYGLGEAIEWYRGNLVHHHGSSITGQHTQFHRLPNMKLAIWISTSEDTYFPGTLIAPLYTILDDILGVADQDRWDWEEELYFKPLDETPTGARLPTDAIGTPGLSTIEGLYQNPAYGRLQVERDGFVGVDFSAIAPTGLNLSTQFVAKTDDFENTHYIFTPYSGNIFNWTDVLVYPRTISYYNDTLRDWQDKIIGGQKTAAKLGRTGTAVFTPDGVGMFGIYIWDGSAKRLVRRDWEEASGSTLSAQVRNTAEVWFERL